MILPAEASRPCRTGARKPRSIWRTWSSPAPMPIASRPALSSNRTLRGPGQSDPPALTTDIFWMGSNYAPEVADLGMRVTTLDNH